MIVLGIETSCDETAAALVQGGRNVLRSVVASQETVHRPFRGVVPELASRAHLERINAVIDRTLRSKGTKGRRRDGPTVKPDAIAVTTGPGLVGCLLIGSTTAQMIGKAWGIPVVGVNHLEGHLVAALVEHPTLQPPFLGLIVSGGHTELWVFEKHGVYKGVGRTRDDAAGECFDKVATLLGLPYPGGPSVQRAAEKGKPDAVFFPRAWIPGTFDFSFSGLKTSVRTYLDKKVGGGRLPLRDLAASFQEAVVDVLVTKTLAAAKAEGLRSVVVGGGVAASRRLREVFTRRAREEGLKVFLPDLAFCTDNAAMIAAAGFYRLQKWGRRADPVVVNPNQPISNWRRTR